MPFLRTSPFLLLSFLLLILRAPPSSADYPPGGGGGASSGGGGAATVFDFIRDSCNATLYPDVCYRSLSRYASAVSRDPAKLASAAIGVSLSQARHAAAYFSNLTRNTNFSGCDRNTAPAVHDCSSTFSDAVFQMRGSLSQMRQIEGGPARAGTQSLRFQLSNVQTWMSAALTYEDTCTDGFEGVSDWPLKTDVCDRATKVMKFTSNALALVNRYASSIG